MTSDKLLQESPHPSIKPISDFLGGVIHGDCIAVMQTMPRESVNLVVTDPPYLVNYRSRDGRRCGNDDNDAWLKPSFREIYRVLKPDSFLVSFYGWPWIDKFMQAWKQSGFRPVSHLVWPKSHCSKKGYMAGHHEVGYLLAKGRPPLPSKPISDVLPWEYTENESHPNQKPVVALAALIEAFSNIGATVLDPFAGSGSTAVAAQQCGRRYILIEKDENYCRAARLRLWQESSEPEGMAST